MARSKPLSNRQKKARRSPAKPRAIRAAQPVQVGGEVETTVLVETSLKAEERRRLEAAVALAVREGQDEAKARASLAGDFGMDPVAAKEVPGAPGNPLRARSRDGLLSLFKSKSLTAHQVKAGLAYRLAYEEVSKGLGSGLGNAGMAGTPRDWTALDLAIDPETGELFHAAQRLHRSYLLVRLNAAEMAVAEVMLDGRELHALRLIAGERRTVLEIAGVGGNARAATRAALARALDAVARGLRIRAS